MSFRIRLTHPAAPLAAAPSHARRGNSRCGAGLVRNLLRGMVCAVLTVQMLTGCARSTPQEPVQWDLSPEAQRTYATLLLDQSIRVALPDSSPTVASRDMSEASSRCCISTI